MNEYVNGIVSEKPVGKSSSPVLYRITFSIHWPPEPYKSTGSYQSDTLAESVFAAWKEQFAENGQKQILPCGFGTITLSEGSGKSMMGGVASKPYQLMQPVIGEVSHSSLEAAITPPTKSDLVEIAQWLGTQFKAGWVNFTMRQYRMEGDVVIAGDTEVTLTFP